MYELLIENKAEKEINDLPKNIANQIIKQILKLKETPRPSNCRKIIGSKNAYRIRVRDYRIIYEIIDKQKEVRILKVKHRREVYR